jgi:transposase
LRDGSREAIARAKPWRTLSSVSAFETARVSRREDFWIIVAARSEDETEFQAGEATGGRCNQDIRRATRRLFSAEEKIRVVLEGLRGEESIAELCRREGIASSMYYGWSKEFLEAGKQRIARSAAPRGTIGVSRFSNAGQSNAFSFRSRNPPILPYPLSIASTN